MKKQTKYILALFFFVLIFLSFIFLKNGFTGYAMMHAFSYNENYSELNFSIIEQNLDIIKIENIYYNDKLNISYVFDNRDVIGDGVGVDIFLINETGFVYDNFTDLFSINKDGLIKRNVLIDVPEGLDHVYLSFSLVDDVEKDLVVYVDLDSE